MPIENELKYVLPPALTEQIFTTWQRIDIKQGYLDDGPRLRQYGDQFIFTYKKWVDRAHALIEIETALSQQDFDLLFPLCTNIVHKTRFVQKKGDNEWVVDFLKNAQNKTYFVLAEVEMPENTEQPSSLPDEIKDHIIHRPAKGDKNFTNKYLADENHARTLLSKLSKL